MAKKFFYNRVYNTKRTIINVVIIGVCVIGVIICFIVTSNFQNEGNKKQPNKNLNIVEATIEINEEFTNEIFFSKIENVDVNDLKVTLPDNFDKSKPGEYNVVIEINNKNYDTKLKVVDTTNPELVVKPVTINEGESYTVNDFVESCQDNSKEDCIIEFYKNGMDENGEKLDYSLYKDVGNYIIKISAFDVNGNHTIKDANLTIKGTTPPKPIECKYGNNEYDTDEYLLAVDITANGCALSLDKYKDPETTKEIDKIMENETVKIQKEVMALKLEGKGHLYINRKQRAIVNKSGDGIIGYELVISVNVTGNNGSIDIVEYKINSEGKRVFIYNPYNLAE